MMINAHKTENQAGTFSHTHSKKRKEFSFFHFLEDFDDPADCEWIGCLNDFRFKSGTTSKRGSSCQDVVWSWLGNFSRSFISV